MKFLKKHHLFALLIFVTITLKAQHKIPVPNVDLIAYNGLGFMLYEKIGDDSYREINTFFSDYNSDFHKFIIENDEDNYTRSREEIKEDYTRIVTLDQLKSNGLYSLKSIDLDIIQEEPEEGLHKILTVSDNNFVSFQELEFVEASDLKYTSQESHKLKLPNPSKWEISDMKWYQPVILNFGNNKEIMLLNRDSSLDITIAIIPLTKKIEIVSARDLEILKTIPVKKNKFYVHPSDYFYNFDFDDLYIIKKDTKNKYRLYDTFQKDLLDASFDKIDTNENFIVCKKGNMYTIYNSLLEQLKIELIKSYAFNDIGIEVLTKNGKKYFDPMGNEIPNLPEALKKN